MEKNIARKLTELNNTLSRCTRVFNQAIKYENRTYFNYEILIRNQIDMRPKDRYLQSAEQIEC